MVEALQSPAITLTHRGHGLRGLRAIIKPGWGLLVALVLVAVIAAPVIARETRDLPLPAARGRPGARRTGSVRPSLRLGTTGGAATMAVRAADRRPGAAPATRTANPMYGSEQVLLRRETRGIQIPDGTPVDVPAGTSVRIAQALGDTYTLVLPWGAMVRIEVRPDRPAALSVDGRSFGALLPGDSVVCTGSAHDARLITFGPRDFHAVLKAACDTYDLECHARFKAWCDEYFFMPHRGEPRGAGGIFFDYLDGGDWQRDFAFVQAVGAAFLGVYPALVRDRMDQPWTVEQRRHQLVRRGRYVEFNLLYDRGTTFGLRTGGNVEAILMSLPPEAAWP